MFKRHEENTGLHECQSKATVVAILKHSKYLTTKTTVSSHGSSVSYEFSICGATKLFHVTLSARLSHISCVMLKSMGGGWFLKNLNSCSMLISIITKAIAQYHHGHSGIW